MPTIYNSKLRAIDHNNRTLRKIIFTLRDLNTLLKQEHQTTHCEETKKLMDRFDSLIKKLEEKQKSYEENAKEILSLKTKKKPSEAQIGNYTTYHEIMSKLHELYNKQLLEIELNIAINCLINEKENTLIFKVNEDIQEKIKKTVSELAKEKIKKTTIYYLDGFNEILEPLIKQEVIDKINTVYTWGDTVGL